MVTEDVLRATAQSGFKIMSSAIFDFVSLHPEGVRNDEVARGLNLETNFNGGQRNYLTFSILSALVQSGKVTREKRSSWVYYLPAM